MRKSHINCMFAALLLFAACAEETAVAPAPPPPVPPPPPPPSAVAVAGADFTTNRFSVASLDGSASTNATDFAWEQTSGPNVIINGADQAQASFEPRSVGVYEFELTATGTGAASTDLVAITVQERPLLNITAPENGGSIVISAPSFAATADVGPTIVSARVSGSAAGVLDAAIIDGVATFDTIPVDVGATQLTFEASDQLGETIQQDLLVIRNDNVVFFGPVQLSVPDALSTDIIDTQIVRVAVSPVAGAISTVEVVGTNNLMLGELFDDGNVANGDDIAGDGVFSGVFNLGQLAADTYEFTVLANTDDGLQGSSAPAELLVFDPLSMAEIEATAASFNAAVASVDTGADQVVSESELAVVKDNLMGELLSTGGVSEVMLSDDQTAIIATFNNNLSYALLFIDQEADGPVRQGLGSSANRRTAPTPRMMTRALDYYDPSLFVAKGSTAASQSTSSSLEANVIGNNRAIGLGPFEFEFGGTDETNLVFPLIQASTTPTFTNTPVLQNAAVTVDDFRRFDEFGVSIVASHGSLYTGGQVAVYTSQEATAELQMANQADLMAGRLFVSQGVNVQREGILSIIWPSRTADVFGVLPSFITRYNSNMPNSLVIFSICSGASNNTMANAFISSGAGAFLSYSDIVQTSFAGNTTRDIVSRMIEGDTVSEALTFAQGQNGVNDGGSTPAEMILRGNVDLVLETEGLLNGSFERQLEFWESNGGDVRVITGLSTAMPVDGNLLAIVSSGLGSITDSDARLSQTFRIPSDATTLSFTYNVVSEEPLEFIGSAFDDQFEVRLFPDPEAPMSALLARETVNTSTWIPIPGTQADGGLFDGGDGTPFQTGRQTVSADVTSFRGMTVRLEFRVFDLGDSFFDTAALIDNVTLQ